MEIKGISKLHSNGQNVSRQTIGYKKIYIFFKRCLDILLAGIGLLLLLPVFLIIALLIKREEPHGTVLYKQVRIGLQGEPFVIYKFRTMEMNAEQKLEALKDKNEATGPLFKMKNDPRITKIGNYLRKFSLDELPQLVNVVRGQMSLVGPRPALPNEVAQFCELEKQRLVVKPGCSGLAQISGRSDLSFTEMISYDLEYVSKCSIRMDLLIIVKTIGIIIFPKGAY